MKNVIIILIIAVAFYYVVETEHTKLKKTNLNMFTESDARQAIAAVNAKYGATFARMVEKIMRYETANFKSGQFQKCGTAGMVVSKQWPGIPSGLRTESFTVKGKKFIYYVWNPTDFALYLAAYINRHGGNFAAWNSSDPVVQQHYRDSVIAVSAKFA